MNITRNDVDNDFMQLKGLMKVGNDSTPSYFSTYDNIYLFTNDRLKDIFEPLDVTQGILTVTGSGDQALMAILKGAKNVKMFDINKLAKYFALFKFSAVSCLSYDEFIKLYKINKHFSNYVAGGFLTNVDTYLYEKVCSNLENTVALFFELLFDVMINATICEKFNLINVKHYPKLSGYLTRKNYEKLQENMKKLTSVDFVDCNIFDLNKNLGTPNEEVNRQNAIRCLDSLKNAIRELIDQKKRFSLFVTNRLCHCFSFYSISLQKYNQRTLELNQQIADLIRDDVLNNEEFV